MKNYLELKNDVKVSLEKLSELDDMLFVCSIPGETFEKAEAEYDSAVEALSNFLADNAIDVAFEAEENFLLGYSSRR